MDTDVDISDFISELISKGYSSLARDEGSGNLDAYKEIDRGLRFLKDNAEIQSNDVSRSVVLLKLLVDLRENIIKSAQVMDYQIPNIHNAADKLSALLIKSANQSLTNDDQNVITIQCEAFLNAADEIRKDEKLKTLGILDGRLKNAIGRLRKKSSIESIFTGEEMDEYHNFIEAGDRVIKGGTLEEIGSKFQEIKNTVNKLEDNYPDRLKFIKYMQRFEKNFHLKLKSRTNALVKKINGASIYETYEVLDELRSMKKLEKYHQNKGLTRTISKLISDITKTKTAPVEQALDDMKYFILDNFSRTYWKHYEGIYEKKFDNKEPFLETFYQYTIKSFLPQEASSQLKAYLNKLKRLDLNDRSHIILEQNFIQMFEKLIAAFDRLAVAAK